MNDVEKKVAKSTISPQQSEALNTIKYNGAATHTLELPRTHIKGIMVTVMGNVTPSWASGTPKAKVNGLMDAITNNLQVVDAGGNLVDVKPRDLRYHTQRVTGQSSPPLFAEAADLESHSVGFFKFPTTSGTTVSILESVYIPFDQELAEANFYSSILRYNGKDINKIKLNVADLKEVQADSDATAVSYDHDLEFQVQIITTPDAGGGLRWKRWSTEKYHSAAVSNDIMPLDSVRNLLGLKIEITKGVDRKPVNTVEAAKIGLQFYIRGNGSNSTIKDDTLLTLQYADLNKKKIKDIIAGVGYMNFLSSNMIDSALSNNFNDFQLRVTLPASLDFQSGGYNVRIVVDEVE